MKIIKIKDLTLELNDEQVKELKIQLNNEKQGRWKPEIDEWYWYIDDCGDVGSDDYDNDKIDSFRHSIGNMYKTEEEAREALKTGWVAQLQAETRIKDYIAEKGYDTNVDWGDSDTKKYCILYDYDLYDYDTKEIGGILTYSHKISTLPYFVKSEDRDDVMEHCADDYKLLFGVE
jgi:hypothetical protein